MKNINVCGIICEYNPFHNGHLYQLKEARKRSGADYIVAVMSGNFVQRGEPAAFDKWSRAEMALSCGVDMVVELPAVYALSSAEFFAAGAVDLLDKMGIITHISFGSETFDGKEGADELESYAANTPNGPEVDKKYLKKGYSYAAASRNSSMKQPNDVLAAEYVRALKRLESSIQIVPVKRIGSEHNMQGSAMHIRRLLADKNSPQNNQKDISHLVPPDVSERIKIDFKAGRGPVDIAAFDSIVLADLRRIGEEGIAECPFVSEGLEHKIYSEARRCTDIASLVNACTSRRYTASRIRRIIFAAMLGIEKEMVTLPAPYIRVLGMRRNCGPLMDALMMKSNLPVITSKAKFRAICVGDSRKKEQLFSFLRVDNNAADLYALAYPSINQRTGDSEFRHPLIFI